MKYEDIFHKALLIHYYSHNKVTRLLVKFDLPSLLQPIKVLSKYNFYNNTGFQSDQFQEIINKLKLISNTIIYHKAGYKATKELALYILLNTRILYAQEFFAMQFSLCTIFYEF